MASAEETRRSTQGTLFAATVLPRPAAAAITQGEMAHLAGLYAGITYGGAAPPAPAAPLAVLQRHYRGLRVAAAARC